MALEFTDSNFQETALGSSGLAVVDFWAEWCGPCRLIGPIIEDLANEYGENESVTIGKLDVDNNPQVALKYGIRSIPTILFIKDGDVVDKHVGTLTKTQLQDKIESQLG